MDEVDDKVYMTLQVRRKGPGVPDELYVDFDLHRHGGWKGPYLLSTSAYDLMIDRQKWMKRWNEYGTDCDESDSTDTSTDDEESSSSEDDEDDSDEDDRDTDKTVTMMITRPTMLITRTVTMMT